MVVGQSHAAVPAQGRLFPGAEQGAAPSVLVVDDNRDFAENVAEIVEEFGCRAVIAGSVREARESGKRGPIDIAIVDIQLPDGPGTRVLAYLREFHPACVSIVFTGNATLHNAVEALNRGAFAYIMKGGEVEEFRAVFRKALELLATATELRETRSLNQAILANYPGKILVLDAEGRLILANQVAVPILDEARVAEALRSGLSLKSLFDAGSPWSQPILEHFDRCRALGQPVVLPRVEAQTGKSQRRYVRVQLIPCVHERARFLALIEDVTSIIQLEAEIEKSASLAAVGEMTAMIAHEIRNPLSGISGAIQVLRKKLPEASVEREVCNQVVEHVDRLNRTIEDLLVLARPMTPKLTETALNLLVESTVNLVREDAAFRDVKIVLAAPETDRRATVDPFLLRQALMNLLINAAQAMGGHGEIRVSLDERRDVHLIRVQDSGPGFRDDPEKLFEPFYTTKPAGTGLGLPITKKILQVHGGGIGLRNHERGGAEVVLTIPVSR